jgi:hypothetical protein
MPTLLLVPHAPPHRECVSPDERLPWDEGTQRPPHGSSLVPRRPQRVKRLLVPLCAPPTRAAAERPCGGRPQRKRVLHRWRREGACQQEDSVRRSTAPCAHNQPRSPRSHEVRVRSARSCLTQLARLNLATGRWQRPIHRGGHGRRAPPSDGRDPPAETPVGIAVGQSILAAPLPSSGTSGRRTTLSVPSATIWSVQGWPRGCWRAAAYAEPFDRADADAELVRSDASDPMASESAPGPSGRGSSTT